MSICFPNEAALTARLNAQISEKVTLHPTEVAPIIANFFAEQPAADLKRLPRLMKLFNDVDWHLPDTYLKLVTDFVEKSLQCDPDEKKEPPLDLEDIFPLKQPHSRVSVTRAPTQSSSQTCP
jgi:hypothetical protein